MITYLNGKLQYEYSLVLTRNFESACEVNHSNGFFEIRQANMYLG
jgi:hypothetical protein